MPYTAYARVTDEDIAAMYEWFMNEAEAIDHSLRYVTDADLEAIAVYLQSVPAAERDEVATAVHRWGEPNHQLASVRGAVWPEDQDAPMSSRISR